MLCWTRSSSPNRMFPRPRLADPSPVKQAPDHKALMHTTNLFVESLQLATPFEAQQYLEPGINVSLKHRRKPKANYELPSDMPKYPLGFVPINHTPGALGEEPALVRMTEGVPADLMDMFSKISAQQAAESSAVEEAKRMGRMDVGTIMMKEYTAALDEKQTEARIEKLISEGFSELETQQALQAVRMEKALEMARKPVIKPSVAVETVMKERFGKKDVGAFDEKVEDERAKAIGKGMDLRQLFAIKKAEEKKQEE